jgi:hypothetical protein
MCIRTVLLLLLACGCLGMGRSLPGHQRRPPQKAYPYSIRYRLQIDEQIRLHASPSSCPRDVSAACLPAGRRAVAITSGLPGVVLLQRSRPLLL